MLLTESDTDAYPDKFKEKLRACQSKLTTGLAKIHEFRQDKVAVKGEVQQFLSTLDADSKAALAHAALCGA